MATNNALRYRWKLTCTSHRNRMQNDADSVVVVEVAVQVVVLDLLKTFNIVRHHS